MRSGWSRSLGRRVPGVELDHVGLRRADQRGERVDLDHRLVVGRDRRIELRAARGLQRAGVRWKKSWPPMPAGARTSETGRLTRCGRISRGDVEVVVDDVELGDAGRGVDDAIGVADADAFDGRRRRCALRRAAPAAAAGGCRALRLSPAAFALPARLLRRRALSLAAASTHRRRRPAARGRSRSRPCRRAGRGRPSGGSGRRGVHSPNDTSATSFGSTQWPRTSRGFSKNGVVSAGIAASACFTAASVFWSKPLPTPPAKRRCPASSWMPSRSEPMPVREPLRIGPAADDELLALRALQLDPGRAAPRHVGRVGALADHALEAHPAGVLQQLLRRSSRSPG